MAKRVKGHHANKPNDSFGTVNNEKLYRGKHREDVDNDEDDEEQLEADADTDEESATPVEAPAESFASAEESQGSDEFKKRYDDLKRHYDSKLKEWRDKEEDYIARLASSTVHRPTDEYPSGEMNLDNFKQQYPDMYDAIHKISSSQAEARVKDMEAELGSIKEREKKLEKQKAYEQLLRLQPDFEELKASEDFTNWLQEQPETISDGVYNNATDAKWASRVVDLYKADKGLTKKPTRSRKKEDAAMAVSTPAAKQVATKTGDKRVWKASEIGKMKPWEFEKLEAELDTARSEGRIDYNS